MKRVRTILTSLATCAALVIAISLPADADTNEVRLERGMAVLEEVLGADDPGTAMNGLSVADRQAFNDVVVPVKTEATASAPQLDVAATDKLRSTLGTSDDVSAAACWTAHATFKDRARAGNVLYTWWQGLSWCASGGNVTSYYVYDRGGETSTPGWSYIGNGGSGSVNLGWEARQYTQEKFRFATQWVGFTRTKCAQIRGGATGLYSRLASCNIG